MNVPGRCAKGWGSRLETSECHLDGGHPALFCREVAGAGSVKL